MTLLLRFTKEIADVVALNAYLKSVVGSNILYVNYKPNVKEITVAVKTTAQLPTELAVRSATTTALSNYIQSVAVPENVKLENVLVNNIASIDGQDINVNSNLDMNGKIIGDVADPTLSHHVVTKNYTDSLSYLVAGTGLAKTGSTLSVRPSQTQITEIGPLSSLSVTGLSTFTGFLTIPTPTANSHPTTKLYADSNFRTPGLGLVSGTGRNLDINVGAGMEISGNALRISSSALGAGLTGASGSTIAVSSSQTHVTQVGTLTLLNLAGRLDMANNKVINLGTPTLTTDAASKGYVDNLIPLPGAGLVSSGSTFNINVGNGIEVFNDQIRLAANGIGTGLLGGSGTVVSVNSLLPHVTQVGTLTNLTVGGIITASGGIDLSTKKITNLDIPTLPSDAATKLYVDGKTVTPGAGLIAGTGTLLNVNVGTGLEIVSNKIRLSTTAISNGLIGGGDNPLSVSPLLTHVTSVGTLSDLSVSGIITASGGINAASNTINNVLTPVSATDAANKSYVDSKTVTPGLGLITGVGTAINVNLASGLEIFSNAIRIASTALGTGLTGASGAVISVSPIQTQITQVGTLTALSVTGAITASGGINVSNQKITNLALPTLATDAASKTYVDGKVVTPGAGLIAGTGTLINVNVGHGLEISSNAVRLSTTAVGTGLTGAAGLPLSVNPIQSQITQVGSLTSLIVTGLLSTSGGIDMTGQKIVNLGLPTLSTDAVSKFYVDGKIRTPGSGLINGTNNNLDINVGFGMEISNNSLRLSSTIAGTGLLGGGATALSVNGVLSHVTQLGSLTNLTVLGPIVSNDTSDTAVTIAGGVTLAKSLSTNDLRIGSDSMVRVTTSTESLGKTVRITNHDSVNLDTRLVLENSFTGSSNSTIRLFTVGNSLSTNKEYLEIGSTAASTSFIRTQASGTGIARRLTLNSVAHLDPSGQVILLGTSDSTSISTGSLVVQTGGVSVGLSLYVGGKVTAVGGIDANSKNITNVATPTLGTHAANMAYVDSVSQGLKVKESCYAATTEPILLADLAQDEVIDGETLVAGQRVLVKNQTNAVQNGIYIVNLLPGTTPLRASDMAAGSDAKNAYVFVNNGSVNMASGWSVQAISTATVGTAAITFAQFSGAGQITAGDGILREAGAFSVQVDEYSIEISNNKLRIKSSTLGTGLIGGSSNPISVNGDLSHVHAVGVITAGTWQGSPVNVAYGGTGLSSVAIGSIIHGIGANILGTAANFTYTSSILTLPRITMTGTTVSSSTTTGALICAGGAGISGNLFIGGTGSFTGSVIVAEPTISTHATTKNYVDTRLPTAGTGITKTGSEMSVNANQNQVTTLGTLTSLNVSGLVRLTNTTVSTSTITGAMTLGGGFGMAGSLFVGGTATFIGNITSPSPVSDSHVTTKLYVDSTSPTAGTGLSKTGYVFSVKPLQPQITSVGTLTGLTIEGTLTSTSTAPSVDSTTGAITTLGGMGIGGSLNVDDSASFGGNIDLGGYLHFPNATISRFTTTGYNVFKFRNLDSTNINTVMCIANDQTALPYHSIFHLSALGSPDTGTTNERLEMTASNTGGVLEWKSTGTGVTRPLKVYSDTIFNTDGTVSFANTTPSTSDVTGAVKVAGGLGVTGNVNVGGNFSTIGTGAFGGQVSVPLAPTLPTHATSKQYTDSIGYIIAGTGITKTANTLSVATSQTQIVTLGTLTGLTSSGQVVISNTIDSSSTTTGALRISGGLGISASVNIGGTLTVTGATVLTGKVSVPAPTVSTDAVSKQYVDDVTYLAVGAGLTKTINVFSINAAQPTVTSVGTLTGLISSGVVQITNTTVSTGVATGAFISLGGGSFSKNLYVGGNLVITGTSTFTGAVTVPAPTAVGHATTKTYVDSLSYVVAGTGLTKTGATLSVSATQSQITSVGTLTSLTVSGASVFTGTVIAPAPTLATHVANKSYVDSAAQGLVVKDSVYVASTGPGTLATSFSAGITMDGMVLSIGKRILLKNQTNLVENGIYIVTAAAPTRSTDFSVGMNVKNNFVFVESGIVNAASGWVVQNTLGNDTIGTHGLIFAQFSGAGQIIGGQGLTKTGNELYVNVDNTSLEVDSSDNLRIASTALGTGLTGASGYPISLLSNQPTITSVGVLTSLTVSGTTDFMGSVTIPVATEATEPVQKLYVDSLDYLSVGSGLTKTGDTITINSAQPTVTSLGTLTSLTSSGVVSITNTSISTSITTGALLISGGTGIKESLYVGNMINVVGQRIHYSNLLQTSVATSTESGDPSLVYRFRFNDAINKDARISIGNIASVGPYESRINFYSLNTNETSADTERLELGANKFGGFINWKTTGVGAQRPLAVYDHTIFQNDGTVDFKNTTTSVSVSTGAVKISGGLGVQGPIFGNNAQLASATVTALTAVSLNITGTTDTTGSLTGAFVTRGDAWFDKNVTINTLLTVVGQSTFTGKVTVPTPTVTTDAVTKGYVDSNLTTAGTGLSKVGLALNVNTTQPQITSLGTLTSLVSSGVVSVTNTTDTASLGVGSLVLAGGTSIAKGLYLGGNMLFRGATMSFLNNVALSTVTGAINTVPGVTMRIRVADTTNTASRLSIGNSLTTMAYESALHLFSLNTLESSLNSERLELGSNVNGGYVKWVTTGTGVSKSFSIYSDTIFGTDGTVSFNNTTTSVSSTTGAVKIAGGLGVIGAVNLNSTLSINGVVTLSSPVNSTTPTTGALLVAGGIGIVGNVNIGGSLNVSTKVTVPNPVDLTDASTKGYVDSTITTAGTGLTKTGTVYSVNASQTQVTTVGTLSLLNVTGSSNLTGGISTSTLTVGNTTDSSTLTTGAMTIAGGLGVAKNITAFSLVAANIDLVPYLTGSWIDIPTTGPSAIGTGGPGSICWIGYSNVAGQWFTDAAVGDICYKNTLGKILIGNTTVSGMSIVGNNVGLGTIAPTAGVKLDVIGNFRTTGVNTFVNTTDATVVNTGSLITAGSLSVAKTLVVGGALRLQGTTTSAAVDIKAPAAVTASYTVTMPAAKPVTNGELLHVDATGTSVFQKPIVNDFYRGITPLRGLRFWSHVVTTTSGIATFYATSNNLSTGTALFATTILFATAEATVNTTTMRSVVLCCLKSISLDRRTIVFNCVTGVGSGSTSLVACPNATSITCTIIGY